MIIIFSLVSLISILTSVNCQGESEDYLYEGSGDYYETEGSGYYYEDEYNLLQFPNFPKCCPNGTVRIIVNKRNLIQEPLKLPGQCSYLKNLKTPFLGNILNSCY